MNSIIEAKRAARALLENPETRPLLTEHEVRICELMLKNGYFSVSVTDFQSAETRTSLKAMEFYGGCFLSLRFHFQKEIEQWTTEPSDKP